MVRTDAYNSKSFIHEIGHLQGCHHQPGKNQPPNHAYAQGYYYGPININQRFRTIMAAEDSQTGDTPNRILQFSDPQATYQGVSCGTNSANNVLWLTEGGVGINIGNFNNPSPQVSGSINNNTTWSGKINVMGNVTVANGVSLTISSGTTVYFKSGTTLTVNGTLNANTVVFKSAYTWGGIQFNSGSNGLINSCTINNVLTYGGAAISINNASPTIQNCTISNNSGVTS